jgi:two component transcriptional regulator, araC family
MIHIVIVEDENLVRLGIKACLEAEENIVVSGAFATAEEAEEQIEKLPVDILLTDIRLPKKSGLDLMRDIREKIPRALFVVLSCYEDFSYAQKAIEYGAVRYLLKHELDETKLPLILSGLVEGREITGMSQTTEYPDDFDMYIQKIFKDNIMNRILYFKFIKFSQVDKIAVEADLDMKLARCIIQEQLDINKMGKAFLYMGSDLIAFVKGYNLQDIDGFLERVRTQIKMYANSDCFMGVSDYIKSKDSVKKMINKAKDRLKCAFYIGKGKALYEDRFVETCPQLKFHREDAWSAKWFDSTINDIKRFIALCSKIKPDPDDVFEVSMRFIQEMIFYGENYFDMKREEVFIDDINPTYTRIHQFNSIKALEIWLIDVVEVMVKYVKERLDLHYKIKNFLDEHYMDELVQAEVASRFKMGATYFSSYFKHAFGINYILYLNQIRIEKAKILLATTNDSAEKVGIKVGITNVNYFFRLFKKIEGCTVDEYRKKYN